MLRQRVEHRARPRTGLAKRLLVLPIALLLLLSTALGGNTASAQVKDLQDPAVAAFSATPITNWTLSFASSSSEIAALVDFKGKLYATGHDSDQSHGRLYMRNGTTWSDLMLAESVGVQVDLAQAVEVYEGKLYIGTRVLTQEGVYAAQVFTFDGKKFAADSGHFPGQAGFSGIEDFAVHKGALYAANGSRSGMVYQRTKNNGWIPLGGPVEPGSPVRALASFNGALYAGTGTWANHAKVWRWDGVAWIQLVDAIDQFGLEQDGICSLAADKGILYASGCGPGTPSPILAYDGTTWTVSKLFPDCSRTELSEVNGEVWAGTCQGQSWRLARGQWQGQRSTGEVFVGAVARWRGQIYVGTSTNGKIFVEAEAVEPPPPSSCASAPAGIVSLWLGEGDASDAIGVNGGTAEGRLTYATGVIGQAFQLNGLDGHVRLPAAASLNPAPSFSIDAWVYPAWTESNPAFHNIMAKWSGEGGWTRAYSFLAVGTQLEFAISDATHELDGGFHAFLTPTGVLHLNTWNHVAAVYDQSTGTRNIYVDGLLVASRTDTPVTVTQTAAAASIGARLDPTSASEFFLGAIDEVGFYGRALSATDVSNIYAAGPQGKCVE